jgi:hypothetical protein
MRIVVEFFCAYIIMCQYPSALDPRAREDAKFANSEIQRPRVKPLCSYYTVNLNADVSKNEISSSSFTAQITTQKATS